MRACVHQPQPGLESPQSPASAPAGPPADPPLSEDNGGDTVDPDDPVAFLWPEHMRRARPNPELSLHMLPPSEGKPLRAVLRASHFVAARDGTRALQVGEDA